jgi:hypothetical protein
VVQVAERVVGPEAALEFFPRYEFPGTGKERGQYLEGLAGQPNGQAGVAEFPGTHVSGEGAESNRFRR